MNNSEDKAPKIVYKDGAFQTEDYNSVYDESYLNSKIEANKGKFDNTEVVNGYLVEKSEKLLFNNLLGNTLI